MPKSTEALKQAHERLTEAVESIVTGEDWTRMLKVASKSTATASTTTR